MFIGERLKLLREEKNITQMQLGKIFNVSDATINRYEKSHRQPDSETLNKIADYFDVSVDYLLGRTDDRKPSLSLAFKQGNKDEYEVKKRDDIFEGLSEEDRKQLEDFAKFLKSKGKSNS